MLTDSADLVKKICKQCGVVKPVTEFYIHPHMADVRLNKCKSCKRNYAKSSRSEKDREYDRRRRRSGDEYKARATLNKAIIRGDIKRPLACWACGSAGAIEGHHADYSNPLGVVFLCRPCHTECHRLTNAIKNGGWYGERMLRIMKIEKSE